MKRIIMFAVEIIKKVLYKLPQRFVLFESAPDFSDNTKPVFDEMIRRGLNKRYCFVWLYYDSGKIKSNPKNVLYISGRSKRRFYYFARAKCVICCNRFVMSDRPDSFNIYLAHGNPLKNTKGYYNYPNTYNYILASSEGMKKIRSDFYGVNNEKLVSLGYPRNDELTMSPLDLHSYFNIDFQKVIVWYPTFRQHKAGGESNTGSNHALPIIWDTMRAEELNQCAKENRTILVIKPHFAQDISAIKQLNMSNIVFIQDGFFSDNGLSSYRFVGSCDAMISDYSSIYYDYTLCDKPIGLVWEDYDEYKKKPGFAVNMDQMMKGGVKIYDLDDFKGFIQDVANGVDKLKDERREIRDFANCSIDGKNTQRVVDFIVEKAKL